MCCTGKAISVSVMSRCPVDLATLTAFAPHIASSRQYFGMDDGIWKSRCSDVLVVLFVSMKSDILVFSVHDGVHSTTGIPMDASKKSPEDKE